MSAAGKLHELERRLQHGRAYGGMSEAEQDELMEQMDALWPRLTAGERAEVNVRAARLAKLVLSASDDLGVDRPPRDGELPRTTR